MNRAAVIGITSEFGKVFEPIEPIAMTPEEWQRGDSRIADYARNGKIVYG